MRVNKTAMSQEERTNILPVKHTTFVLQRLNEQRIKGLFCDVSLHVDGKKFRAHRSILAANSDFFLNLFRAAEDQTNFVLAGVPVRGFAVLLEFCYTNSFTLEPSNVSEVYRAASVLNFSHIASACEKVLTSMRPKIESLTSLNSLASLGPLLGLSSLSSLAAVNGLTNGTMHHKGSSERNSESPLSRNTRSPNKNENHVRSPKCSKRPPGDGSTHEDSNTEEDDGHVPTINAYMVFSHHMRLKALQEQSKESPVLLERSISRQWSSLGLEERRPFYEEAERIREALHQTHLQNHLQGFGNRFPTLANGSQESDTSDEPPEKRSRLTFDKGELELENVNETESSIKPKSPPESINSPRSLSPDRKTIPDGALSPISNNSQSPNSSQRRKKAAPARRIPEDQVKVIKIEK